jgi:hypothetical protein
MTSDNPYNKLSHLAANKKLANYDQEPQELWRVFTAAVYTNTKYCECPNAEVGQN